MFETTETGLFEPGPVKAVRNLCNSDKCVAGWHFKCPTLNSLSMATVRGTLATIHGTMATARALDPPLTD